LVHVSGWVGLVALLLVGFSILQKRIMGLPFAKQLDPRAYIIPIAFGGTVGALLGTYQLRLRRSNQDLSQSLERLHAVMDTVPAGIILVDVATKEIVDANRYALELVGHGRDQLVGTVCHGFICPSGAEACPFTDLGLDKDCSERVLLSAQGERVPVIKTATTLYLNGRKLVLECFLDLRERISLEEQLRHAQRMETLGKTAAGIVHDFNNILTAIQASVDLAGRQTSPDSAQQRHLAGASAACDRASRLVRGLRAFNQKTPLDPHPMDLNQMVLEVEDLLRRLLPGDLDFRLSLWSEPLIIWGDSGQLGQVLLNLAVNARDAMAGRGTLSLLTASSRGTLRNGSEAAILEMRDTGCGIPAEHLAHIFDAFFTTKGPEQGSGLGLSIVKGIIEQHHGEIQVESAPGQGTLVRILLPLQTG
jgi:PAS domain S-box-containing protein